MTNPTIPLSECALRRGRLAKVLRGSIGVVFAGESAHGDSWRPHPHFEYLTGVTDEPGAVLVLDPSSPVKARREMLFLRPLDPELEKWDGYRMEVGAALRERAGMKSIFRTTHLPRILTDAARRARSLACLHTVTSYDAPIPHDLALFRRIAERLPGMEILDRSDEVARLRSIKSDREVAMIGRAIEITALGFDAVLASMRAGLVEHDVQETLEHAYRTNGSRGTAFGTIVGAGINSTVLHYRANTATILDGDLVCIDTGASYGGYGADVTRTLPANGRFTDRQREVYEVVLLAMEAAIRSVRPGVTLAKLDQIARAVITKAGLGDYFIHSIGHHLGLETHDAAPPGPLREGAVITIEPGVYIPAERLGVRIEDDVLVTKDGRKNLASAIPKTVEQIEHAMAGQPRPTKPRAARTPARQARA